MPDTLTARKDGHPIKPRPRPRPRPADDATADPLTCPACGTPYMLDPDPGDAGLGWLCDCSRFYPTREACEE